MENKEIKTVSAAVLKAVQQRCAILKMADSGLTVKDIEKKYEAFDEAKEAVAEATKELAEKRADLNGLLEFAGMPMLTDDTSTMPQAELITKLEEVMPSFPNGANGKEIAAKIGLGMSTIDIAALYWTDGQDTLKKTKGKDGKVLIGLKTKYLLAKKDDLEEINQDKEKEKKQRDADKAKRKTQQSANSSK